MVLGQRVVLEQSTVPEPIFAPKLEDIRIPDVDDVVIDILTDQVIDFDERSTEALAIFVVTGGDKKSVEVNERMMTDGVRKLFGRAKEAELQSWLDHNDFDVVLQTQVE